MKKNNRTINFLTFAIFLSGLLAGCTQSEILALPIPTATETYSIQTTVKTLFPTSTTAPTITQVSMGVPTPKSTYTVLEAKAKALALLTENGDCDFPCVWGITPEITSEQSIDDFVTRFGKGEIKNNFFVDSQKLYLDGDTRQFLRWMFGNNSIYMDTTYVTSKSTLKWTELYMENHQKNILLDSGFPEDILQYYELSQVLSNYGVPSEILMFTNHDDPQFPHQFQEFSVALIYYEQGFLASYIFPRDVEGQYFLGCPSKTFTINLGFWDQTKKPNLAEILKYKDNRINKVTTHFYKHIEEVSSMSKEDFYQTFKDAEKGTCIKTEASQMACNLVIILLLFNLLASSSSVLDDVCNASIELTNRIILNIQETIIETPTPTPSQTPALKSGLAGMKSGMSVFQSAYYVYDRGAQRSTPPKASEGAGSGDGNLMRGTVNGRVTFYPGRGYNQVVEGSSVTVQKFYALGSLTIAVRTLQGTQDTLNWVLSDHLGSTSVTANADGSWNSTLKYTAFGEVRSEEGSTPTEYKYTGQLEQVEIGLYYYVARWYDSELAHFVQADTLVPQPGDAAAWDRFAYTLNNPIRFNDPSGHFCQGGDLEDGTSRCLRPASQSTTLKEYTTDERRALIYKKGIFLSQAEGDDSLIKFGKLVSYASTLYDDKTEVNEFVLDLTCAINNYCKGHPLNVWKAGFGSKYDIGDPNYYLKQDLFPHQGSWSNSYFDNTNNQMYHFWFYVAVSYFDTLPVALAGNYYHDPVYVYQFIPNDPLIEADNGISIEDFNLGYAGAYLGLNLRLGSIRPSGVGDWLTENLSQQNNGNDIQNMKESLLMYS